MPDKIRYSLNDLDKSERVIIYGAGKYGKYIKGQLEEGQILCFVDENAESGQIEEGIEVHPVQKIRITMNKYTYIIAVVNPEEKRAITRRLINLGIINGRIVVPLPNTNEAFFQKELLFYEEYLTALVKQKMNNCKRIYKLIHTNSFTNIALVGPKSVTECIASTIYENDCSFSLIDKNSLKKIKQSDAVIICYVMDFLYYQDKITKLTQVPILNLMEVIG